MSAIESVPLRNPYVTGRRVTGSMFYGRVEELGRLRALLRDSASPQHVQIVGEIRSGKSSLIGEFLRRNPDLPFIILSLDLSVHFRAGTAQDFFRQLLEYVSRTIENSFGVDSHLVEMLRQMQATSGSPSLQRLGDFFGELERVGQHMLIVLDEFDHSLELFKLDEQAFKYLRHMAANFISLTLVTASRRSIFDIECDAGLSSNLAGVIPEHVYVSLLTRDAAEELCYEPAQREGVTWEPQVVDQMLILSGCHACLTQRLGWQLYYAGHNASLEERIALLQRSAPTIFAALFDDMERRLRRFGLWSALAELVHSGNRRIEPGDRDRLIQLGYIVIGEQGVLRLFTPLIYEAVRGRMGGQTTGVDDGNLEAFIDPAFPRRVLASDILLQESDENLTTAPPIVALEAVPLTSTSSNQILSTAAQRANLVMEISPAAFDIAIICALRTPELKKVLDTGATPWHELDAEPDDPSTYHAGIYTTAKESVLRVVAAAPSQMGMPAAAVLSTKMVRRFRPKLVAMVGIAAGVKGGGRGFGDILAPDCTFDYGAGKMSSADHKLHFSPDPNPINIGPLLRNRLKDWELKGEHLARIRERWPHEPPPTALRLHVGPLGSGAAVIAATKPVEAVRIHWRKLLGIEMEAYGVHLACQEGYYPPPVFLCLKSVCDFADDEKTDDWQHYAAYTAAQLCHLFLTEEWERLFLR